MRVEIVGFDGPAGQPARCHLIFRGDAGHHAGLFPHLEARLDAVPIPQEHTALFFVGTYKPPMGLLGGSVDALAPHHHAEESLRAGSDPSPAESAAEDTTRPSTRLASRSRHGRRGLPSPAMSRPVITVFGASRSRPGDGHYEAGERCGRLLAEAGFSVATGGYGGLMEAVSRGAQAAGGAAVGVTAPSVFPDRPGANAFVTEELRAASLVERIHQLTELSVASIALHGSLGTLTELVVAWNVAFVARLGETSPETRCCSRPAVAIGRGGSRCGRRYRRLTRHLC